MIPLWMFPMALICGNTYIMKPSERDPTACMALVELLKEAGQSSLAPPPSTLPTQAARMVW